MSSSTPPRAQHGGAKKMKITVEQQQQQLRTSDTESTQNKRQYEAELLKLRQELEAEKAKTQTIKAEMESERQRMESERQALTAKMEAWSLLVALRNSKMLKINLTPRGSLSYHSHPKNKKATSEQRDFPIPDISLLNDHLQLELRNSSSCLGALIESNEGILTYENEHDVQAIIHNALCDAARICNIIISKIVGDTNYRNLPHLAVRRESTIFSNVMDHTVVFDALSGAPVFVVEAKNKWGEGMNPTGNVYGQVFDQLSEMHAKGHPNPFGALTCFDETYITWLDNDASKAVIDSLLENQQYTVQRLEKIIRNFVVAPDDTSSPQTTTGPTGSIQTQSPVQEILVVSDANTDENSRNSNATGVFCPCDKVHVLRSKSLTPPYIVEAFVSAIICSLDGFQKPRGIQKLTLQQDIVVECLRMDSESYSWGTLRTKYRGPKKLQEGDAPPKLLFLVDHLGTGSTSKVYRALTLDGYDCVVKMYIKRQDDDKKILTEKKFRDNAKAAITKEYEAYQKIYRDELKGYVWMQELNGMYCLIHPYFQHLEKNQRAIQLPVTIPERLSLFRTTTKNVQNDGAFYAFHKSDQLWRHIGWFNGKLYMFDLGNLEQHELNKSHDLIHLHCETLRARILD
jgi:hypothetical protein